MFINPRLLLGLAGGWLAYKWLKKARKPVSFKSKRARQGGRGSPHDYRPDDLTAITGIGPKIQSLLRKEGIVSYAQLADAGEDRLTSILKGAPGFHLMNPPEWIEEAKRLIKST